VNQSNGLFRAFAFLVCSSPLPLSSVRETEKDGMRGEPADRVLEGEDISSLKRKP